MSQLPGAEQPGDSATCDIANTSCLELSPATTVVSFSSPELPVIEANKNELTSKGADVTVSGSVKCLGDCPIITITLKPVGFGKDIKMPLKNGMFVFENQLPGSYVALVSGEGLCFETDSIPFKIESDPVNNLHFKQTGWVMEVHSSHETVLKFSDTGTSQGDLDIPIGHSVHCMPTPGPYKLTASSCHMFHQDEAANTWSAGGRVRLRAVRHLVSGSVTSTDMIPDLQMTVSTESEGVHTIALTSPENKDGLFLFK